ncbi:major facilitator superfamily domain-containing protein [Boletus edulis BED1]|uniref:Major facilitator superfamily domain-containing protein n=1 Tax=Boletus edulis BED1 TaxID=1328754 RepID=A0AAD4GLG3_BOLED|nr:major facilitator superfamily domain-containing protein [Boletus edulis BED1]
MDLPNALALPAIKVGVAVPLKDVPIALSPTANNYSSSRPSVVEYSEGLYLAPITTGHASPDCDTNTAPETKPQTLKTREYIQFVTLCWFIYLEGWNDGTNGPLLPRIQQVYGVGYAMVSLIFVFACLGFITGAILNVVLTEKLGFGKVTCSLFQVIAYSIESSAPPFPVFVCGYFINGIGLALQNAQSVGYVASIKKNAETKMGGGALCSPLVATQFSQLNRWSFHYLTSLGIALINTITLIVVFRLERQEVCLARIGISSEPKQTSEHSQFRQIFALKDVHLLASFILFYVGAEVTMGGWIVTYIIDIRGGGVSSGYISTGFFAGLMIGRVALLWINEKIGERLALLTYAICAIGLELVIWFVPSLVGDAVAVAIIGVLVGPMYPIAMNHCSRVIPRRLLTGSIGWIAGSGQAGSALVPFMAGAIASKAGIATLQPVLVGILGLMTVIWVLVPKSARRHDQT